jgi:hypothetical protein
VERCGPQISVGELDLLPFLHGDVVIATPSRKLRETISPRHLRELIARGLVAVVRLGRCTRVPRSEVDRLCGGAAA